jgi:hypothetical protein
MSNDKSRNSVRPEVRKQPGEELRDLGSRHRRTLPGRSSEGDYFHIGVRDVDEFISFRTQDIGDEGALQRVAGQRASGGWDTVTWLVSKRHAHLEDGRLVADRKAARDLLNSLGSVPERIEGDFFRAKPRPSGSRKTSPSEAQLRARRENLEKAREARRRKH